MSKHFEITVLGSSLAAMSSAALLARHGFRVLVIGMRHREGTYSYEDLPLARRLSTVDFIESPLFQRVLADLGQVQAFPRRFDVTDPSFQVIGDELRLDVARDPEARRNGLATQFGDSREAAAIRAMESSALEIRAAARELLVAPFLFPAEGILKKTAAEKRIRALPFANDPLDGNLFGALPPRHPWARALRVAHSLSENVETRPLRAFSFGRAAAVFANDLARLTEPDGVLKFFSDRVLADGGEVRLRDRVDRIEHDGTRVSAIQLAGDSAKTHTDWLLGGFEASSLFELLLRGGAFRAPDPVPEARLARRYILSVVVRTEGLSPLLADRAVLLGPDGSKDFFVERTRLPNDRDRLTVSWDIEEASLATARETVLSVLETHLPFIERHYEVVDSPHDGRPVFRYENGKRRELDRTVLKQWGGSVEREPMEVRSSVAGGDPFQGDPPRPFFKNVILASESVVPGFGSEGGLLSALSAVSFLVERDPQKGRIRRKNWTKIEIG